MPKIPQYQSYGNVQQQLPTNIYSNINVSPNDLGAGMYMQLGEAISRTSNIASQQLLQYAEEDNKNKARESLNNANQEMRDFYNQAMQRHPKDNANFHAELTAKSKEIYDKTSKSLSGGARQYFTPSYTDLTDQYLNKGLQFQTEQQGKYKQETLTAQNEQAFNDVYAGVIPMNTALNIVKANSTEMYKNLSPEGLKLAVQNDVDKAYIQYASGLAKRNPQEAIDYITFNKEQMNPVTADKALYEFEKVNKDFISKNSRATTNATLVMRLDLMSEKDFLAEDLTKYAEELSGTDYRMFRERQEKWRAGEPDYFSRTTTDMFKTRVTSAKITDINQLTQLHHEFNKKVNSLPKEKRNNELEIKAVLDDLLTPIGGSWLRLTSSKYKFELDYLPAEAQGSYKVDNKVVPENLKDVPNLQYKTKAKAFVQEQNGHLKMYDENTGKLLESRPMTKKEKEEKKIPTINEMKFRAGARY